MFSRRTFVLWENRGEVLHEFGILLQFRPKSSDWQLIIVRYWYFFNIGPSQQLFLVGQYFLQEIFSHEVFRRQIKLDYKIISNIRAVYVPCWSKYVTMSCLDLNFHESSLALRNARLLFLDWVVGSSSIFKCAVDYCWFSGNI